MGRFKPLDPSSLLIDQDRRLPIQSLANIAGQTPYLVGIVDIAAKKE